MEKALSKSPKFQWDQYDLAELKKEYYEIWTNNFMKKYKVWRWPILVHLWVLPEHVRKQVTKKKFESISKKPPRKKLDRLENTTKVARYYEKAMNELDPVEYIWPLWKYMNNLK